MKALIVDAFERLFVMLQNRNQPHSHRGQRGLRDGRGGDIAVAKLVMVPQHLIPSYPVTAVEIKGYYYATRFCPSPARTQTGKKSWRSTQSS